MSTSSYLFKLINMVRDGFTVTIYRDGYNATMLQVSRTVHGVVVSRQVALPEDHLSEEKLLKYLMAFSVDTAFVEL